MKAQIKVLGILARSFPKTPYNESAEFWSTNQQNLMLQKPMPAFGGGKENNALGVVSCQYSIQYLMETVTV